MTDPAASSVIVWNLLRTFRMRFQTDALPSRPVDRSPPGFSGIEPVVDGVAIGQCDGWG
jgi:hypothetical protein